MLSAEEERDLIRRWQDNEDYAARNALVNAHIRFVMRLTHPFTKYGIEWGDLIQAGTFGLMRAAGKFDLAQDVKFSTYAAWWVKYYVRELIINSSGAGQTKSSLVRRHYFSLRRLVRLSETEIAARGEPVTQGALEAEVSAKMGVPIAKARQMMGHILNGPLRLDAPRSYDNDEDAGSILDTLVDPNPSPEESAIVSSDREMQRRVLLRAMRKLNARERDIVFRRRIQDPAETLEEIGLDYSLSKERIRQIEARAFEKLRHAIKQSRVKKTDLGL